MRLGLGGRVWPWFAAHFCAALMVLLILRWEKQATIRSARELLWTIAAAILLAAGTLAVGALAAAAVQYGLGKPGRFSLRWAISSITILLLLSLVMIVQT